jgi:hypothetical protein
MLTEAVVARKRMVEEWTPKNQYCKLEGIGNEREVMEKVNFNCNLNCVFKIIFKILNVYILDAYILAYRMLNFKNILC